jgi:hypothetical protein
MPTKTKLIAERRVGIFCSPFDHSEAFRKSCGLACKDVYGGFVDSLQRTIDDNWIVVAVTRDVAGALIESNFDMKLVQRAHRRRRLDRYVAMIAFPREEQYDFFMEQDQVTLTTRTENHKNGTEHWSEVLQLPESIGCIGGGFRTYFTANQRAAFVAHFGGF